MSRLPIMLIATGWLLLFSAAVFATGVAGPITPSGLTNTHIHLEEGRAHIHIAPNSENGISHNHYSVFHVPKEGVSVDNRDVQAQLIIHEVAGMGASRLEGDLSIQGRAAHQWIINPNGISVNGASFSNTSGIILAASHLAHTQNIKGGFSTDNYTLQSVGAITVEHLEDTLKQLALLGSTIAIKRSLQIAPEPGALVMGGGAHTVVLTGHEPERIFMHPQQHIISDARAIAREAVVLDMSSLASLAAGSITMLVTEEGVGLEVQGAWQADKHISIKAKGAINLQDIQMSTRKISLESAHKITFESTRSTDQDSSIDTLQNFNRVVGHTWYGGRKKQAGFILDHGKTKDALASIHAKEMLIIHADEFENIGGNLLSPLIDIAAKTVRNEAIPIGSFHYQKKCGFRCHETVENNIRFVGGNMVSPGTIAIAAERIVNQGGTIYAHTLQTGSAVVEQVPILSYRVQGFIPGLSHWVLGKRAFLRKYWHSGSIADEEGQYAEPELPELPRQHMGLLRKWFRI